MSDAVAARAEHEVQILATMVDCAYKLSMALGEAAKAETDKTALLKLSDAFFRGFQAVRLGIRLRVALCAPPKPTAATKADPDPPETEKLEVEPLQVERAERLERERDRDYEPVSLPRFLATLGVVATEAERIADRLPAEVATQTLPTLRELLARAKTDPPGGKATPAPTTVLTRPRPPKAALLSSASAPPPRPVALRGPNLPRPPPRPPR